MKRRKKNNYELEVHIASLWEHKLSSTWIIPVKTQKKLDK